ncbi:MAG: permease [Verrucomicrobia bacterium]|nr:MAG: permease [Verrucomicrobiota bacterium]
MIADLKFALRMLVKNPAFSIVAFLAIALGIGANATIFGIINALILRPLPVGHSDRLVRMYTADPRFVGASAISYPNFLDYSKQDTAFTGMAGYAFAAMGMTRGAETRTVFGEVVTGNYFDLLEVKPALGRTFLPEEDTTPNGHPVVVLGHKFWKSLGGDPGIIGSIITLNGHAFTVIGVAPPKFGGVDTGFAPDMWLPMAMHEWVRPVPDDWFTNRRALFVNTIGRLKAGVSLSQAQAQMKTVARQLEQAYPDVNKERSVVLKSAESAKSQGLAGPGNEDVAANVSLLLLAIAASILLIACANVANLLLARATTRQREMAIRLAVGAGRGRLIRQLLTESALLGLLGGIGGILCAYWLGDVLLSLLPATPVPVVLDPHPDLRVLLVSLALAILSGVIFGLAPALQMARWNLTEGLRERVSSSSGAIGRWNLRNLLVVAQVAVSLLLLIGSGLFLKAFRRAQAIDPGFRTENLAIVSVDPSLAGYDPDRGAQVVRRIVDEIRRKPEAVSAGLGRWVPLGTAGGIARTIIVDGRDENAERNRKPANVNQVSPGYFETLGIPLLRGRNFTEQDAEKTAARVAVINDAMAQQFWPNEDPVGRRFHFIQGDSFEVIGITRTFKSSTIGETPTPMVYLPFTDVPDGGITFFVHTAGTPGPALSETRRIIRDVDNRIPITYEKTVRDHMAIALWPSWMGAMLLAVLGALALVLASMGVYGVMAYSVSQRTRELGIRMALGAQSSQVLGLIFQQGMLLAAMGIVVGLLGAFGSTRLVQTFLYGVNPGDPTIFLGVTLLLTLAALAACYFPARRALKINPVLALRTE